MAARPTRRRTPSPTRQLPPTTRPPRPRPITENSAAPVAVATAAFDTTPEQESRIRVDKVDSIAETLPEAWQESGNAQGRDRIVRRSAADPVRRRRDDPDRQRDRHRLPRRRHARTRDRSRADVVGEPLPLRRERAVRRRVRQHHRHRGAQGEVRLRLVPRRLARLRGHRGERHRGERAGRRRRPQGRRRIRAPTRSRSCSPGTPRTRRPGSSRRRSPTTRTRPTSCSLSSRAGSTSTSGLPRRPRTATRRPARPRSSEWFPAAATSPPRSRPCR